MIGEDRIGKPQEQSAGDALKNWIMTILTLVFVCLYASALFGWLKPLTDVTMIARLEPIIFVIIGYYFGRLPAQQNEATLKGEIMRQTQKAEIIQQIKEQIQREREALEEKLKNAKINLQTLASHHPSSESSELREDSSFVESNKTGQNSIIAATVNILDS